MDNNNPTFSHKKVQDLTYWHLNLYAVPYLTINSLIGFHWIWVSFIARRISHLIDLQINRGMRI